jgi:hypothetical protein
MNSERGRQVFYLFFNFFSTVAVTFINKLCFTRVNFGFPAALCNIHFLVTFLGVETMRRVGIFQSLNGSRGSSVYPSLRDPGFLALVVVVGIVTPLNNTSLKLNSVGFYQIFKLLVTPGVLLLEYILDKKVLSKHRALAVCFVCAFVFLSSRADLNISFYGTLCASIWVPFAAAYKVQWGRARQQYACSTLQLMHVVLPHAIVVQLLISPLVDPPGVLSFQWTQEAVFWIGLSGFSAFLVNFSGFLVMGNIGALAHVLLGQLKTAVIMIGSLFIFGTYFPKMQIIGALGAICSIVAYTRITMAENDASQIKMEINIGKNMKGKEMLPLLATTKF